MSEYKSFEDGWRKHSRIHKRIEKLQTTITKMKQKISQTRLSSAVKNTNGRVFAKFLPFVFEISTSREKSKNWFKNSLLLN